MEHEQILFSKELVPLRLPCEVNWAKTPAPRGAGLTPTVVDNFPTIEPVSASGARVALDRKIKIPD